MVKNSLVKSLFPPPPTPFGKRPDFYVTFLTLPLLLILHLKYLKIYHYIRVYMMGIGMNGVAKKQLNVMNEDNEA